MEFFDKIGKKASETYQVTKEKTVKFSEEIKLKAKSAGLKSEIEKLYVEIGEKTYLQYKNNISEYSDEIVNKCKMISDKFDEIMKIEDEILKLKKVKKCIECQEEIDINSEFCQKCGKPQPAKCDCTNVEECNSENIKNAEVTEINDMNNNNE